MASLREIADITGIGLGTVSRALSGNGYVSEEKLKLILEAAERLNYQKSDNKKKSARKRTGIIGISVPDMEQPFFTKLLKYIEIELHHYGYYSMMVNSLGVYNRVEEVVDLLKQKVIDGAVLSTTERKIQDIEKVGDRIVTYECKLGRKIPQVHSDHMLGGELAAKEFLRCGSKKVLQISSDSDYYTPSRERHRVFERILENAGVKVVTVRVPWTNLMSYDYYRGLSEQYMQLYPDIDGLFAEDISAYFALRYALELGKRVPEDFKIVGYDGIELTKICSPMITTVVQDVPAIARKIVSILIRQMNGESGCEDYLVPVYLYRGGTT